MMTQPKKKAFLCKYTTVQGWLMFGLTCICAVIFVSCWLFWMVGHQAIAGILLGTGVRENEAVVSYRDAVPPGKLSDVTVNEEGVFLLYETAAVVRAYSHDGVYQYSLMFSNPSGRSGQLYSTESDLFYHQVSGSGLYHVKSGIVQAKHSRREESYSTLMTQLQTAEPMKQKGCCWYDGLRYCIDGQDVLRICPSGTTEKFIDGPDFLGMLERAGAVWPCALIFMLMTPTCWIASQRLEQKYMKKTK